MPQSNELVEEQIKSLGNFNTFGTKKEIKYLPEVLDDDEKIYGICSGFADNNTWLITITNKRMLFLDKGMIYSLKQFDIRYNQITAVGHKKGLILSSIQVDTASQRMKIDNVEKEEAPKIVNLIREQMEKRDAASQGSAHTAASTGGDFIAQIERLALLKQSGALSEEEFEQAKKKLLS